MMVESPMIVESPSMGSNRGAIPSYPSGSQEVGPANNDVQAIPTVPMAQIQKTTPPKQLTPLQNPRELDGLPARVDALEDRVAANGKKIDENGAEINAISGKIDDLLKIAHANATTISGMADQIADANAKASGAAQTAQETLEYVDAQIAILNEKIQEGANTSPPGPVDPVVPTDPPPQDPGNQLSDVLMYYTSRDCTGCRPVDEKIAAMKANGWPIVVTYLNPRDAEVKGVPRLFVPYQNKHVIGIANCQFYLASLMPR